MSKAIAFALPWRIVSWCLIRAAMEVFDGMGLQDKEMEEKVREFVETYNWIHTGQ